MVLTRGIARRRYMHFLLDGSVCQPLYVQCVSYVDPIHCRDDDLARGLLAAAAAAVPFEKSPVDAQHT